MVVASQQSQGVAQVPLDSQSPAVQLPPSERDLQVFEEIAADGLSTREVAARHRLSQTRIMQIRRKVALWMAAMPAEPEMTPLQQIRLAREVATMRTDKLYGEAMRAWTASQQPQAECRGTPGSETRTVRSRHGDPRYLAMATRIAERQLHMAVIGSKAIAAVEARQRVQGSGFRDQEEAKIDGWDRAGRAGDGREGEASAEPCAAEQVHPLMNPLNRACSLPASSLADQDQSRDAVLDASDCDDRTCDEVETRRREFLNALAMDTAPVQPPVTDANGMQIEEPEAYPDQTLLGKPAVAPGRPLNRQERRARQKLLERKLRKAK
jgi:hypothetical protein